MTSGVAWVESLSGRNHLPVLRVGDLADEILARYHVDGRHLLEEMGSRRRTLLGIDATCITLEAPSIRSVALRYEQMFDTLENLSRSEPHAGRVVRSESRRVRSEEDPIPQSTYSHANICSNRSSMG